MCHSLYRASSIPARERGGDGAITGSDRVRLAPEGAPAIEGVIDFATPAFAGVRTSDGGYRLIHAEPLEAAG
jgi:hypothetical protein